MSLHFSAETNSASSSTFSEVYPMINSHLWNNGKTEESRNGSTKEILNFKTELHNPYRRCVGGNKRDMNIFFLIAEAVWIFKGRKDVEFLETFNSRMPDYSDDGKSFHAPYGFRLRNYGISSFDVIEDSNKHAFQGLDQILEVLQMLSNDSTDRRAVCSIWNPELDLNVKSKDIPCNDLYMLKIRDKKLHSTISNRSNDLHWGLPTNVFQFSFLTEVLSEILGVGLGSQTHNSQSLHFYIENPIAMEMHTNYSLTNISTNIYDYCYNVPLEINWKSNNYADRLSEIDRILELFLIRATQVEDDLFSETYTKELRHFSTNLYVSLELLRIYNAYTKSEIRNDEARVEAIRKILDIRKHYSPNQPQAIGIIEDFIRWDIIAMSLNFFFKRIKDKELIGQFIPKHLSHNSALSMIINGNF